MYAVILPATQFGGRPGRTTTDAIHLLTQKVKDAWRKGFVVSALFLDIQAAFPNVVKPVLLRNMRTRGIPEQYVSFIERMLTDQSTRLKFDDYTSEDIPINNGNSQGCPLSMLLYSFYIAPLLESARGKCELILGFVDDTTLLAIGRSFPETHSILKNMMIRPGGALDWSFRHNSPFELSKVAIMDFTKSIHKAAESAHLDLEYLDTGQTRRTSQIKVVSSYKLLGVMLDSKLNWTKHHDLVLARAVKWTALFKRLNRMTTGISLKLTRRLYLAVAVPRITYAADTWYVPSCSPADAAKAHADLLPINLLLMNVCFRAAARLATLPKAHPLFPYVKRTAAKLGKRHRTPLHYLFHRTSIKPNALEKITPYRQPPNHEKRHNIKIAPSKEEAIRWEQRNRENDIMIYTDGSGCDGGIGAAAVLYRKGVKKKHLQRHLGPDTEHTVYEGELVGILLALHLHQENVDPLYST
jgi:hypothetical protein